MRHTILLGLFLVMAITSTSYAQQSVDPSTSTDITLVNGTTVNFDIGLGALSVGTINIQAKELPGGAITAWSAFVVNVGVGGIELNFGTSGNSFTPNNDSVYEISYSFNSFVSPSDSSTHTFYVFSGNETLSIGDIATESEFSVFSKDGMVTVKNDTKSAVTRMAVYSASSGKQVFLSNKSVTSIDLRGVANGIYVLSVQEGASIATKKFIKS